MERDDINEKKAAKLIKEVDEKRASFHKFCTGKEWEDASQYQLSIDSDPLICWFIRQRLTEEPPAMLPQALSLCSHMYGLQHIQVLLQGLHR